MIETQLALLYNCVGRTEEAKVVMKKGLDMNKSLKRSISDLATSLKLLFLQCYPDTLGEIFSLWKVLTCTIVQT